jgi:hypothetical protein
MNGVEEPDWHAQLATLPSLEDMKANVASEEE